MATKIQQFLREQGVTEHTEKDEVDRLKKEYWKQERVRRNKEYRASRKEVRYSLPISEWRQTEQEAKQHNMTVTEYARQALIGYRDRVYIAPDIPAVDELTKLVRNIATNVNTAVQFMHLTRNYGESADGLGRLREELNLLFGLLKNSIQDKPELYAWLQHDLEAHPERLAWVHTIISKVEQDASS